MLCRASSVASSSKTVWRSFSSCPTRFAEDKEAPTSASSSSAPNAAVEELPPAGPKEEDATPLPDQDAPSQKGKGFRAWLRTEGAQYKVPVSGRTNWIGKTPFPMNPTFNPKPPLPDAIKTKIYNAYLYNSSNAQQGVSDSIIIRAISTKFGVGMDRVRAVIRLKELEHSFKQRGIPLQTELQKGMESHLGVKVPGEHWKGVEPPEAAPPALGSRKTVFEMLDIESDEQSVFLPLLEKAKKAKEQQQLQRQRPASESAAGRGETREVQRTLFRKLDGTPTAQAWQRRYEKNTGRASSNSA